MRRTRRVSVKRLVPMIATETGPELQIELVDCEATRGRQSEHDVVQPRSIRPDGSLTVLRNRHPTSRL